MYSGHGWQQQNVDESEDAEVQGILGGHGRGAGNSHNRNNNNNNNSNSNNGGSHGNAGLAGGASAEHTAQTGYNDYNFLMSKNIFAPSGGAHFLNGTVDGVEQSQLNANVEGFTPRMYMVQMPTPPPVDPNAPDAHHHQMGSAYDVVWPHNQQQQSLFAHDERAQHRTPGPGQTNSQGQSPLNSFRFGFGGLSYQHGTDANMGQTGSSSSSSSASTSSTSSSQFAPGVGDGNATAQMPPHQAFYASGEDGVSGYGMDSSDNGAGPSWYDQLPQQNHQTNPDQGAGREHHFRHQQHQHQHQHQNFVPHEIYGADSNGSMGPVSANGSSSGMMPLSFDGSQHAYPGYGASSFFAVPEDNAVHSLGANFSQLGFEESVNDQHREGGFNSAALAFHAGGHAPPGYTGGHGSFGQGQQGYAHQQQSRGSQAGSSTAGSDTYYASDPSRSTSSAIPGGPESFGTGSGLGFLPSRQRDATASFDSSTDQKSIGTPVSTPQSSPMRGPQMSPQMYPGAHRGSGDFGNLGSPQRGPSFAEAASASSFMGQSQQQQQQQQPNRGGYIGALSGRGGGDAHPEQGGKEASSTAQPSPMAYSAAVTGGMRKGGPARHSDGEDERKEKRDMIGSPQHTPAGRPASSSLSSSSCSSTWSNRVAAAAAIPASSGGSGPTVAGKNKVNNNNNNHANAANSNNKNRTQPQPQHEQPQRAETVAQDSAWAQKKKSELDETPQTRSVFKEFYKSFRSKEKESVAEAFAYARRSLQSKDVPERIHWRIYLEMADLAKRENQFQEARELYQLVNETQPFAHQGWLEYSKMEEECGRLLHCRSILQRGLEYCNYAEQLLTKAIKHEERLGNLDNARALLSRLRSQNVENAWRTILEGALLEARAGNIIVARKVFKYLMENVPWYGPIYFEATRFEEKNEEFDRAIAIVEKGLKEIPRYGPLWFNAFRLHEKTEMEQAIRAASGAKAQQVARESCQLLRKEEDRARFVLQDMFGVDDACFVVNTVPCKLLQTRGALQRAMNCISKELVWKVHFEAAQVAERGGGSEALQRARHAYVQSVLRCPVNLRWKVWLAGARAELAHANMEKARQLLDRALVDVPAKSRAQVLLECSRIEEYEGNIDKAREVLVRARAETRHEWKVFLEAVMLELRNGHREDAIRAAEDALATHSGTGRLWAILVQLKHAIGPDSQRLVFREALKSCPKSGEVWCEGARLHMNPVSPYFDLETASRYLEFAIQFTPQYGGSFLELMRWKLLQSNFGDQRAFPDYSNVEDANTFRANMMACDTSDIELRCVNADPNYGALWFHCKRGPFDTARQVLRTAKSLMIEELTKFRAVYREAIVESIHRKRDTAARQISRAKSRTTPALAGGEDRWLTERLEPMHDAKSYANFSTGLLSVNWLGEHVGLLVDRERRKFLFGSDQIVP
ncbi:Pre-mRNA-splicing factor CLF1 [Hondaea fermentalgiana]|uniref:Pre-mRNA-splicing factor CLF1 n=1 Tax=Hondaea fermentalgiana TaxID=2315210 RepID=A0A2R5GDZ7_9STRA|nr:Pre-mRNA-splicing factor CLF1 [Hondaea fermentalgiana]|eukprot:GBG29162.1 Pre-mRNA-splicing factor CLF1 [Hondaea fermentalgiana]